MRLYEYTAIKIYHLHFIDRNNKKIASQSSQNKY